MNTPIILLPHQSVWAEQYTEESIQLSNTLGSLLLAIEHIGSTAIPDLPAKPILDIAAGVRLLEDGLYWIEPLQQIGYEYVHKPDWTDRLFFRKGLWGQGTHHLHVYVLHSKQWQDQLLFRDYLRKNPFVRQQYAQLKQSLAEKFAEDRAAYTSQKGPFIQTILQLARNEKENHC